MDGQSEQRVPDQNEVQNAEDEQQAKEEKEKQLAQLKAFIEDVKKRNQWKADLRKINQNVESRPEDSHFRKLDSSLKKNTAFIRKLKNYSEAQLDGIRKDMKSLNLTKYIGEVAAAFMEAKLKMTDLNSVLELCSTLHQVYADFAQHFLEAWPKALSLKKNDRVSNPSKLRVDLRFYADLIAVGIFDLKAGLPLLGQALTSLVNIDKEDHAHVSLIITFCKHCGDDYAGEVKQLFLKRLIPKKMREAADQFLYEIPQSSLLLPEKQKSVRQMLRDYYQSLCKHLQRDYKELAEVEQLNRRILLTKGEVHQERLEKAEALKNSVDKLLSNTEQLCDLLDEEMPDLSSESAKIAASKDDDEADFEVVAESSLGTVWEDEETKSFYEDLVDLKAFIPAILYKESSSSQKVLPDEQTKEVDGLNQEDEGGDGEGLVDVEEEMLDMEEEVTPPNLEDEPEEVETTQTTSNKMLLEAFLARLPGCIGREMIDNAASEFCMTLNTKNNRKKLVKALFGVHRNRQDLLPFYARLVATLYPCMPDVAVDLAQYLKQDFRWLMNAETKVKCCRFIGEMVKFKMFLKSEALFCIKMLLFDFTHHHIEMACAIMETCGRFLYRTPDSHRLAKIYLEQMMRKKAAALSMDDRYSMMIENAFYVVNPPEVPLIASKSTRSPIQEYIAKLLHNDLCKANTEKILKQMRKLDWKSPDIVSFVVQCISEPWNVKYYNIRYMASMLAGLVFYYDFIAPRVIDNVLEEIRIHLEINNMKFNQRRIAHVKLLGELYNYRLIDSSLVFKVLYSFITFGVSFDEHSFIDPPDHLLRIRLVCTLLDTCGSFFNSVSSKKKLDCFLVFFQRYFWKKYSHPIWKNEDDRSKFPFSVKDHYEEVFTTLRPNLIMYKSVEEAVEAATKLEREMILQITEKAPELKKYLALRDQPTMSTTSGLLSIAEEGEEDGGKEVSPPCLENDSDEEDEDEEEEELVHFGSDDYEEEDEYSDMQDMQSRSRSADEQRTPDEDEEILDPTPEPNSQDEFSQEEDYEEEDYTEGYTLPVAPKLIPCEEDDEFVNMLDKMVNDNIVENRRNTTNVGAQQMDLVAPMHLKQKKTYDQIQNPETNLGVQFSVLLRKNNKPAYREFSVPENSEIAVNLKRQEEADRLEKERVKKLTLEINERQEEEDLNEAIAAMQRPSLVKLNHRRGASNRPAKGVPDADVIFGNKKSRGGRSTPP